MVEWLLLTLIVSVIAMCLAPLYSAIFFPALAAFGAAWGLLYVAFLVRLARGHGA